MSHKIRFDDVSFKFDFLLFACYHAKSIMEKYIIADPTILSGMPIIKGTRVPIVRILSLLKEGYTLEEIQEQFNHIDLHTLEGALDEVATIINSATQNHDKQVL